MFKMIFGRKLIQSKSLQIHRLFATSISKRIEDRKLGRLALLRKAIDEIYQNQNHNNRNFDWNDARKQLYERQIHFPSNFEFTLLSAFDVNNVQSYDEQYQLDSNLFHEIANFVSKSKTLQSNKIASIRFCVFLSQYPQYLSEQQLEFIRKIALSIANDSIQIKPVIIDIVTALAHSSPENCRLACQLLPKFLTFQKYAFSLRLEIIRILFQALINHRMSEELLQFLQQNSQIIDNIDLTTFGQLISLIAKTRLSPRKFSKQNLIDMIRCLSDLHMPLLADDMVILVDKILKQKLGYKHIEDVQIDRIKGICPCCGNQLTGLNNDEFLQLKQHFKSIIFDSNDQYMMDNLTEYHLQLMDFEQKILIDDHDSNKPRYDLIVDGLNISYRRSKSIVQDKTGLRTFAKVYKVKDIDNQIVTIMEQNYLMSKYKRILLIGRQHMKSWFQLKRMCQHYTNSIDLNLLLDRTRDDNYILYAAIQHPQTMILSSDHFKDHQNKFIDWYRNNNSSMIDNDDNEIRPNLGLIFKRWLKSRQIRIEQGSNLLQYPNQFDIKIHFHHSNDNSESELPILHIPVVLIPDPYDNDDHKIGWICAMDKLNKTQ
uniref:Uncharacterized protein LOC113789857 n=1 Tax=Dermatophagoides pteronyssinus TaxID=6956 RepID=A0A6P6XP50_DERPT|nr:uncharacterized protein LOC113789857 [Dermatophagoides pteronyssinus]